MGGGNVTLAAGGSVINVDAAVPTNARLVNGQLIELGGGNLVVNAGNNIDGGVYYVESGRGTLIAGNNIQTNSTRAAVTLGQPSLRPTGCPPPSFSARETLRRRRGQPSAGPVANPFLLPQSYNNIASSSASGQRPNSPTFDPCQSDAVDVSSLDGAVTIQASSDGTDQGSLYAWYTNILDSAATSPNGVEISSADPWLTLAEAYTNTRHISATFGPCWFFSPVPRAMSIEGVTAFFPPTLRVTSFSGDINLIGSLTLSPSVDRHRRSGGCGLD